MPSPCIPPKLPLRNIAWEKLIQLIGEANAEVGRFSGTLNNVTNAHFLIAPLFTKEAVVSSRIEGTQATLQEVLRFDADEFGQPEKRNDIFEVINYRRAADRAESELQDRPFTLNLIRGIHQTLMSGVRGKDKSPGAFRIEQNFVGRPGTTIEQARFVPPSPTLLQEALDNFIAYATTNHEDPLVQAAILHAQFEIIHPFNDGNGRVGRILIPLYLTKRGLLDKPHFYISSELDRYREEYYDRLLAITASGDWLGWIDFFLQCVVRQAQRDRSTALILMNHYQQSLEQLSLLLKSQYTVQTVNTLFARPILTTKTFEAHSGIPSATAKRILKRLQQESVIETVYTGQGRSSSLYRFSEVFNIIDQDD